MGWAGRTGAVPSAAPPARDQRLQRDAVGEKLSISMDHCPLPPSSQLGYMICSPIDPTPAYLTCSPSPTMHTAPPGPSRMHVVPRHSSWQGLAPAAPSKVCKPAFGGSLQPLTQTRYGHQGHGSSFFPKMSLQPWKDNMWPKCRVLPCIPMGCLSPCHLPQPWCWTLSSPSWGQADHLTPSV